MNTLLRPTVDPALGQSFDVLLAPLATAPSPDELDEHSWGGIVFGIRRKPAKWHQHCSLLTDYPVAIKCHPYLYSSTDKGLVCTQWAFNDKDILQKHENTLLTYQDDPDLVFTACKLKISREQAELLAKCLNKIGNATQHSRWAIDTCSCCQSRKERRAKTELLSTLKLKASQLPVYAFEDSEETKTHVIGDNSSDEEEPDEKKEARVKILPKPAPAEFPSVQPWTSQELIATLLLGLGYFPSLTLHEAYSLRVDELLDKCCEAHHPKDGSYEHCSQCDSFRKGMGFLLI
jgi:hypothetical protein